MRIAIVDGYSTGRVFARMLRDNGAECIHVQSQPVAPRYRAGFPSDAYLDDIAPDDPAVVAARLAAAGVDRVVPGSECGVLLADRLGEMLGLPGNDADTAPARRDKTLMALTVRAAGLAVPVGEAFTSADAALDWWEAAGRPEVVAKPPRSLGTDNVRFCRTADRLREACDTVLAGANRYDEPNTVVLVQERVRGTEYFLNTVSHDGVHRTAELWRYAKTETRCGAPSYDYETPIDPRSAEARMLRAFAYDVLDALGVRYGAAHVEIMLTDRGPVLIEVGARLGGGALPELIERYCGVSQAGLFVDALLDPARVAAFDDEGLPFDHAVRAMSLLNADAGTAGPTDWADVLRALPTTVAFDHTIVPGQHLPATVDERTSPGYLYLAAPAEADVDRDYRTLRTLEAAGLYTRPAVPVLV